MANMHGFMVLAGVAATSSLTTLAVLYLWPHPRVNDRRHGPLVSRLAAYTPEPNQSSDQQPGSVFSPVNKQKRPDPYDPQPRATYLSWDDYFMALAFLSAERSKDPNKQVGACIVNSDNIILSIGYNGFPRGCSDDALPWSKRAASGSILDTKYPYVVHAEANALLNKNQAHVAGARIYVTLFPCNECAKLIIQAGIKEVIFHEAKLEMKGQHPVAMERAAAADAEADRLEAAPGAPTQDVCSSGSNRDTTCSTCASGSCIADQITPLTTSVISSAASGNHQQRQQQLTKQSLCRKTVTTQSFSVGATADVDASYAASQRLLTLAGVKLRQHSLQRSIILGPT